MRFISKSSNLLVVLRPGLSAQPLTGTPAKPTISVRFKEGIADVQQEEIINMMLEHAGFNSDFISADDMSADPYALSRQPSEPAHVMTEMKYGTPQGRTVKGGKPNFPPEIQKLIQDAATQLAKEMLPSMVESTLKSLVSSNAQAKAESKPKGRPGRKPKVKPVDVAQPPTEESVAQGLES